MFLFGSIYSQKVDILGDAMITGKVEVMDTIIFSDGSLLASACLQILSDLDADTKIEVEQLADEDKIRFTAGGIEFMVLDNKNLTLIHNGNSLFIGNNAGKNDDGGNYNLFVGYSAGSGVTSGMGNTILGNSSGSNLKLGSGNVYIGNEAGSEEDGSNNTLVGTQSGFGLFGTDNTFVGYKSGESAGGNNNTLLGSGAGANSSGNSNVFIGFEAGKIAGGSNKLYIDNSDTNSPLIYGEFDNNLLIINESLEAQNSQTIGKALSGYANNTGPFTNYGGYFDAKGQQGRGVYGVASSATASVNYGGYFRSNGSSGRGIYGVASGIGSVTNYGGYFESFGGTGYGIYAKANAGTGVGLYADGTGFAAHLNGDVKISAKVNDAILSMKSVTDSGLNRSRVIVRQDNGEDVYMGDVDPNGGSLFLRANGIDILKGDISGKIGIGTTSPSDRLHINSDAGENALSVQVNGSTRLRVHSNGGVSIGANQTPPSGGLRIENLDDGVDRPIRSDASGKLYKDNSTYWVNMPIPYLHTSEFAFSNRYFVKIFGGGLISGGIQFPDKVRLKTIKVKYLDNYSVADLKVRIMQSSGSLSSVSTIAEFSSSGADASILTGTKTLSHVVDNENFNYYIEASATSDPSGFINFYLISIEYEAN